LKYIYKYSKVFYTLEKYFFLKVPVFVSVIYIFKNFCLNKIINK
jgi:hypothetical protein